MSSRKGGLGKGLDALFADNESTERNFTMLRITEVEPNASQPRKSFDEETLTELAESIKQYGVLQPILVRPLSGGSYQIVAGERRWRAARKAGLREIPAVIRELSDYEVAAMALIENLQRDDLNPIEEAQGYRRLMDEFSLTQEDVSEKVGRSRPAVANALRLLGLPEGVRELIERGRLSTGHAKVLAGLSDEKEITELASRIVRSGMTVRDTERTLKKLRAQPPSGRSTGAGGDWGNSFYKEMELALTQELGRRVRITVNGNKGTLEVDFYNKEELGDIAARLANKKR